MITPNQHQHILMQMPHSDCTKFVSLLFCWLYFLQLDYVYGNYDDNDSECQCVVQIS